MEEVRSLTFETRNEAGQDLRYRVFFLEGGMRLGRGCGALALSVIFLKRCHTLTCVLLSLKFVR